MWVVAATAAVIVGVCCSCNFCCIFSSNGSSSAASNLLLKNKLGNGLYDRILWQVSWQQKQKTKENKNTVWLRLVGATQRCSNDLIDMS